MKWSPCLFFFGFVLIILGVILLLLPSWEMESGFFFIFPFFVFGNTQPFNVFLLFGIGILLFFVMVFLIPTLATQGKSNIGQESGFMAVGSYCKFCHNPIPVNATYCPSCGQTVDYNIHRNEEL